MNPFKSIFLAIMMFAIIAPWRAGLIMFATSPLFALSSIGGDLSNLFVSRMACEEFIADVDLNGQEISLIFEGKAYQAEVVGYELFCYQPLTGEEV